MKNFKRNCLVVTTIACLGFLGTSALGASGTVNAPSGLVLRNEASRSGEPLTTVPDKAEVEVLEDVGEWYKVRVNGQEGFLFKEYVTNVTEIQKPENTEVPEESKTGENNDTKISGEVKVHIIPVMSSSVIGKIDSNMEFKVEKEITNWSYVTAGNIQGWVRTSKIKGETKKPTETEQPESPENTEPTTPEPATPTVTEPETPTATEPKDNTGNGESAVDNQKGFVAVDYANVRKQASTSSEIVTTLTRDTSFTITAETEDWYKITYTGLDETVYVGYIYKNLTTK